MPLNLYLLRRGRPMCRPFCCPRSALVGTPVPGCPPQKRLFRHRRSGVPTILIPFFSGSIFAILPDSRAGKTDATSLQVSSSFRGPLGPRESPGMHFRYAMQNPSSCRKCESLRFVRNKVYFIQNFANSQFLL